MTKLRYSVQNMDCAHCVQTVEQAARTVSGAKNIKVSLSRASLELELTANAKPELEKELSRLGYPLKPVHFSLPWWQDFKTLHMVFTGVLLFLAWLLDSDWAFTVAAVVGALPIAYQTFKARDILGIRALMTLAVIGAIAIGESAEGAVVVFLFAVGEWLESFSARQARKSIGALERLKPEMAFKITPEGKQKVSVESLQQGDVIEIQAGGRIPIDGVVISGGANLDNSAITGESMPAYTSQGMNVFAGALNVDGLLQVQMQKPLGEHLLNRMMEQVFEAEQHKAQTARLIERFSRYYTPSIVLLAVLTAVIPWLLGEDFQLWLYRALTLLLIGCPCALVLAVPAAMTSSIANAARRGVLFKGGMVIETLASIRHMAFDKTGTLSQNAVQVHHATVYQPEALSITHSLEALSSHPLAQALQRYSSAAPLVQVNNFQVLLGQGVQGSINRDICWALSPEAAGQRSSVDHATISAWQNQGMSVVVVGKNSEVLGMFALQDTLRPEAKDVLHSLKALGIQPVMLTGDNAQTAQTVAQTLDIAVQAQLLPEQKLNAIRNLQASGGVAMVGDGINDAPALAAANVGIAMGKGTDVALETADVVLMRDNLQGVVFAVRLSRATVQNVKQNIVLALGLKLFFLVGAFLGYTQLWMAILADTGATVLVTLNALRLLKFKA